MTDTAGSRDVRGDMEDGMDWQPIETCPEGVEVMTKIDDADGERNVQTLVQRTREPGKTRPMFWVPDGSMYVYYMPTHWKRAPTGVDTAMPERRGGE